MLNTIKIKFGQVLVCCMINVGLWNANLAICELKAASLVICKLWTVIQPACNLPAAIPEVYRFSTVNLFLQKSPSSTF